ncbi:serine dehydratase subunit alpha family protein [Deltaproteobacteria bacterium Smac51]|nr:serine dehydratase subunit alpha family protein [Deltaproteobacteria bacterium Smac51]
MDKHEKILKALNGGLAVATGCTEPVAIAYAGAVARSHAEGQVKKIHLEASGNIIKNAFVVGIPGTSLTGLSSAVALGVITNNPEDKLNLLNSVKPEEVAEATAMVKDGLVTVDKAEVPYKLYIKATVQTDTDTVSAVIIGSHTNVSSIVKNEAEIYKGGCNEKLDDSADENCYDFTLRDIYDFCLSVPRSELKVIEEAIKLNGRISREGLEHDYGLRVGRMIKEGMGRKVMADDLTNNAMMATAAGSDARMAGVSLSVMSNSGSGNQGIAATIPVVTVWEKMGGGDEEKLVRATALSNLVTIYIKSKFGVLSALCGAVIAGTGVACAVVYLMEGTFGQMEMAVQNVLGNVTGIVCDGAKSSCALKISTCVNAAMQAAMLAMNDLCIGCNEGIVEKLSENTINNFASLGKEGAEELDRLVLDMIIHKKESD